MVTAYKQLMTRELRTLERAQLHEPGSDRAIALHTARKEKVELALSLRRLDRKIAKERAQRLEAKERLEKMIE